MGHDRVWLPAAARRRRQAAAGAAASGGGRGCSGGNGGASAGRAEAARAAQQAAGSACGGGGPAGLLLQPRRRGAPGRARGSGGGGGEEGAGAGDCRQHRGCGRRNDLSRAGGRGPARGPPTSPRERGGAPARRPRSGPAATGASVRSPPPPAQEIRQQLAPSAPQAHAPEGWAPPADPVMALLGEGVEAVAEGGEPEAAAAARQQRRAGGGADPNAIDLDGGDGDGDGSDGEGDDGEGGDGEEGAGGKGPRGGVKKTRTDRNREARRRAAEAAAAAKSALKRQRAALEDLGGLEQELREEAAAREAARKRRAVVAAERAASGPPRLGALRFAPAPPPVLLSEEVTGSLRQLAPYPMVRPFPGVGVMGAHRRRRGASSREHPLPGPLPAAADPAKPGCPSATPLVARAARRSPRTATARCRSEVSSRCGGRRATRRRPSGWSTSPGSARRRPPRGRRRWTRSRARASRRAGARGARRAAAAAGGRCWTASSRWRRWGGDGRGAIDGSFLWFVVSYPRPCAARPLRAAL
jgi:hypothetical protein